METGIRKPETDVGAIPCGCPCCRANTLYTNVIEGCFVPRNDREAI